MSSSPKWQCVAEVGLVPKGEGRKVSFGSQEIGLFHTSEGFFAVENRCPHRQGPLSDGILSGKTVFCPLHNWNISLESGCALSGGEGQVKTYPTKVEGEKIFVAFE